MKLRILILAVMVIISACKSTNNSENGKNKTASNLTKVSKQASKIALSEKSGGSIIIQQSTPYSEHSVVADKIKSECNQLGNQLSNSLTKYAIKYKLPLKQVNASLPEQGNVVKLTIDNVFSSGNAFIGHRKSATVTAQLFVDGKMVSETQKTRNSAGGVLGGFKGSCSVLAHTVNTLGNDIAKWLRKEA
jgi:hypothetical protein